MKNSFLFFIDRLALKTKLLFSFMLIATLLLITGIVAFWSSHRVQKSYENILQKNYAQERTISNMQNAVKDEVRYISKLSLIEMSEKSYDDLFKKIDVLKANYSDNDKILSNAIETDEQKKLYTDLSNSSKKFDSNINEILSLFKKNAGNPNRLKLVQIYFSDLEENIEEMFSLTAKMEQVIRKDSAASEKNANAAAMNGNRFTIFTVSFGFIIALILGFSLSAFLSNRLTKVSTELNEQASEMLKVADSLIANGVDVRARTEQQLQSINLTKVTTDEINSMIVQNSSNAKISTEKSQQSQLAVDGAKNGIDKLNHAILQINVGTKSIADQYISSQHQMHKFVELFKEISSKTEIINEIVFQTKLLSFNASVEAARAGETGKGFTVVAEEVGNLARSSGEAASEISKLISSSVNTVEKMVKDTNLQIKNLVAQSDNNASLGESSSQEVVKLFKSVELGMTEILTCIGEISSSTDEEAKGILQIKHSINELEELAEENTAVVRNFENQAVSLKNQSASVMSVVDKLQKIVNNSKAS